MPSRDISLQTIRFQLFHLVSRVISAFLVSVMPFCNHHYISLAIFQFHTLFPQQQPISEVDSTKQTQFE
jgi:hypothetical protein